MRAAARLALSDRFDNLDFRFGERCHAKVALPDYGIARVRAGQWLPAEGRNLRQAEFAFAGCPRGRYCIAT